MKGILWYVTRKLEGIFDGILMEFRMRISEDKNQIKKSMYIPRFLSSGLYGSPPAITATSYYLCEVHVYCLWPLPHLLLVCRFSVDPY